LEINMKKSEFQKQKEKREKEKRYYLLSRRKGTYSGGLKP